MHAIRLHGFGPPANLHHEEVDDPEPGPGQVRIAVAAAGAHLIDTGIRALAGPGFVAGRSGTVRTPRRYDDPAAQRAAGAQDRRRQDA